MSKTKRLKDLEKVAAQIPPLFRAAPELLAACEAALAFAQDYFDNGKARRLAEVLSQAINKARGQL